MIFLNRFIPLLASFLSGFWDLFMIPFLCLAFLCTVPYIIRSLIKWR